MTELYKGQLSHKRGNCKKRPEKLQCPIETSITAKIHHHKLFCPFFIFEIFIVMANCNVVNVHFCIRKSFL